jgi:CheY-like chemotaxis protein
MGGAISIDSATGVGTTVIFNIQVKNSSKGEYSAITGASTGFLDIKTTKKFRILIADDNILNQKVLKDMLTRLGHSVLSVSDGPDALSVAEDERFDVIFLDLQMPKMSGIQVVTKLRSSNAGSRDAFVVGLSGNADNETKRSVLEAGMNAFLPKPVTIRQLGEALSQAINDS